MDHAKRCVSQNPVNYTTAQTRCTTNTPLGTEQIEVSKKVSKFIKQTGGYTVLCTTRDRDSRR